MNSHEDFHKAVELEKETLTRLSDYWSNRIKCDVNIMGDTEGRIRATVGKTRLLLAEKFKQFEGLLEQAENNTSEKEISYNDLQGFWELVLLQVNEVKDLFRSFGPAAGGILDSHNNDQKGGLQGNKKGPVWKKKIEDQVEETEKKLQEITCSNKKQTEGMKDEGK